MVTSALAAQAAMPSWLPRLTFAKSEVTGDVLICIFLRGGADGLNIIIPHGDQGYYDMRGGLALQRPDDRNAPYPSRVLDLDGFFGLHPAAAGLLPIFKAGQMTALHAVGSPSQSRSHFDAMSIMERAAPEGQALSTGWLTRYLASTESAHRATVRAVGWGDALPEALLGSVSAAAFKSIIDYHLPGDRARAEAMITTINALYDFAPEPLQVAARQEYEILQQIDLKNYRAARGAKYQLDDTFHMALRATAALIKADIGLEISAIDLGGWDTHENQNTMLSTALTRLGTGLTAFHADMQESLGKVTIVLMSEFGRRVQANASGGTDHGHGNMMMLMSDHVIKRPVVATWPGLYPEQLERGDLQVTLDYRSVLHEILTKRLYIPDTASIFPAFTPASLGIITE